MKQRTIREKIEIGAALGAIYIIWGTSYAAIRVALDVLPPLLLGGARFALAGAAMTAVLALRGEPLPRPRQLVGPAVTGALMLLASHGLLCWAQQWIPSGEAAVLMATMPMWLALLQAFSPGGRRPPAAVVVGIVVGFAGVWLLARPGASPHALPMALAALSAPLWAIGVLLTPRLPRPRSSMMTAALQMLLGGLMLLGAGAVTGEVADLDRTALAAAGATPWIALGYLVIFGSVVAMAAHAWLLVEIGPGLVSTYAFINPLVAVVFGRLALGEPSSPDLLLGGGLVVGAVALVMAGQMMERGRRRLGAGTAGSGPPAWSATLRRADLRRQSP